MEKLKPKADTKVEIRSIYRLYTVDTKVEIRRIKLVELVE